MCVIVHRPVGTEITETECKRLWERNSDGGGFAYIEDDRIVMRKYMVWDRFWASYSAARDTHENSPFLLHMRIATHGEVTPLNVHPFRMSDNTVMAHNGIISKVTKHMEKDERRSDSRYFVEEVLTQLPANWLDNQKLCDLVNEYVGTSRLMFLTTNPKLEYQVYRFGGWEEHNGMWLSNKVGLYQPKVTTYSGGRHAAGDYEWGSWGEQNAEVLQGRFRSNSQRFETSADRKAWNDFRSITKMQFPAEWPKKAADIDELQMEWSLLRMERFSLGVDHPIVMTNYKDSEWKCRGCDESIDIQTAECKCWDKVCKVCWLMAATCDGGKEKKHPSFDKASQHKIGSDLVHWDSLTEKGREFVSRPYGKTDNLPDEMVSQGASNTVTA